MRFLFRTDADATIGTGHLMRCLALAEALHAGGAECIFLCRVAGLGVLADRIVAAGHELLPLPESAAVDPDGPPHAAWLPGGQKWDAAACLALLAGRQPVDWLVVDHYAIDHRWQAAMRGATSSIMVIDDLADRRHDCDLLLDQSLIDDMQGRYDGLVPAHCVRLLGPRYALLRAEFDFNSDHLRSRLTGDVPRLLIMFGGADPQNLTFRTVKLLTGMSWNGPVDVVAGPLYQPLKSLREEMSYLPRGVLHASAGNVAELMLSASLAIGSPGIASWERCACSLPAIVVAQADNQESIGEALGRIGANAYLGRAEVLSDSILEHSLIYLLSNAYSRYAMSKVAAQICDGRGTRRVVNRLLSACVSVRMARESDAETLFSIRNDERVRRYFFNPSPLSPDGHLRWVRDALASPRTVLLAVVDVSGAVCGAVRFDVETTTALVSIYLSPARSGRGIGAAALERAIAWLADERPDIEVIEADVLTGNIQSQQTFLSVGFHQQWSRFRRAVSSTSSFPNR